jgi:hypothetical protein
MSGNRELARFNIALATFAPVISSIDGPEDAYTHTTNEYSVNLSSNVYSTVTYSWSTSSGSHYISHFPYSNTAYICFYDAYFTYWIDVSASTACGTDYSFIEVSVNPPFSPSPPPFPNPVNDVLNFEIDQQAISRAKSNQQTGTKSDPTFDLRIYDGQGNLLRQQSAKGGIVQFNVTNLPDGIYYLHIYDGVSQKPEMQQIMVQH